MVFDSTLVRAPPGPGIQDDHRSELSYLRLTNSHRFGPCPTHGSHGAGVQGRMISIANRPVAHGPGCFFCIVLALAVAADMEADLWQYFSFDILQRQTAVADHLLGILQAHGPKPKAVLPV